MVPEAPLEQTPQGLVPKGEGWFVVNAGEAQWLERPGRGTRCQFEGEPAFEQLGISLFVLEPGEPIGMYHWEADQEDFLVLGGEALTARRHGVSVERETNDVREAYARFPEPRPAAYRDGSLPGG